MASTRTPAEESSDFTYFDYFAAMGADIGRVLSVVWRERVVFFVVLAACLFFGLCVALFGRPVYRVETLLVPRASEGGGGLGRMLSGGGGGGISSLIGLGSDKAGEELMTSLKARSLIYPFIRRYGLDRAFFPALWDEGAHRWRPIRPGLSARLAHFVVDRPLPPVHYGPTPDMTYGAVLQHLMVSQDIKSNVIQLSMDWTDPDQAAQWVNGLVMMLNDARRQDTISTAQLRIRSLQTQLTTTTSVEMRQALINLIQAETEQAIAAQSERQFALRVIDPAVPLDDRIWPKRNLVMFLSLMVGAVIGGLAALIWSSMKTNIAMQRLCGVLRPWRSLAQPRAALDL